MLTFSTTTTHSPYLPVPHTPFPLPPTTTYTTTHVPSYHHTCPPLVLPPLHWVVHLPFSTTYHLPPPGGHWEETGENHLPVILLLCRRWAATTLQFYTTTVLTHHLLPTHTPLPACTTPHTDVASPHRTATYCTCRPGRWRCCAPLVGWWRAQGIGLLPDSAWSPHHHHTTHTAAPPPHHLPHPATYRFGSYRPQFWATAPAAYSRCWCLTHVCLLPATPPWVLWFTTTHVLLPALLHTTCRLGCLPAAYHYRSLPAPAPTTQVTTHRGTHTCLCTFPPHHHHLSWTCSLRYLPPEPGWHSGQVQPATLRAMV